MSGNFSRGFGVPFSKRHYDGPRTPTPAAPPTPAADAEFERGQPVSRDDRLALLRRHFEGRGLTEEEIEAHMRNAKV